MKVLEENHIPAISDKEEDFMETAKWKSCGPF